MVPNLLIPVIQKYAYIEVSLASFIRDDYDIFEKYLMTEINYQNKQSIHKKNWQQLISEISEPDNA